MVPPLFTAKLVWTYQAENSSLKRKEGRHDNNENVIGVCMRVFVTRRKTTVNSQEGHFRVGGGMREVCVCDRGVGDGYTK
mmetsp:Transcript_6043/g.14682  ORF Transcript_6043/g.14682 Transcript_6043/m.14682 type:complete len:80 (+) Transcript_6043:1225-1464(+)